MKSKKVADRLRQAFKFDNIVGYPYNQYNSTGLQVNNELDIIERDLEILEIIKKDFYIEVHTFDDEYDDKKITSYYLWLKNKKTDKVPVLIKITKEEYNKLKDWLEK